MTKQGTVRRTNSYDPSYCLRPRRHTNNSNVLQGRTGTTLRLQLYVSIDGRLALSTVPPSVCSARHIHSAHRHSRISAHSNK